MIPPLSPRSSGFMRMITEAQASVKDASIITSCIQNGVYRNIFSKILKDLSERLGRMASALERRGEYAFPIFGVEAEAAEQEIHSKIQEMKNTHLPKEDEKKVQLVFDSFLQRLVPMAAPFKTPTPATQLLQSENPRLAEAKREMIRVLFEQTLERIHSILDIHPECFFSYSWGNLKDASLIRQMASDLRRAGIQVLLDIWEIKAGDNIVQYIGKIQFCSYILLMGSAELNHKFEQRTDHWIALELDSIAVKCRENPNTVIPCLVSGEPRFPHFLGGGKNLAYVDFRKDKNYYARLLDVILKVVEHSSQFKQIKGICQEFKQQEAFIQSDKYLREKLEKNLQKVRKRRTEEEAGVEKDIDRMHTVKKQTLPSGPLSVSRINLKAPLEDFLIRHQQLKILKQGLLPLEEWNSAQAVRLVVLTGMGGVGKSELACYFANLHSRDFSIVCWISCVTLEVRLEAYRQLAKVLSIYLDPKATPEETFKVVNSHLENCSFNRPWLLIFDNVEESVLLPERGGCILGTSIRRNLWSYPEKCIEIPVFSEGEAIEYVKKRTQQNDEKNIRLLVHELGCFPLALAQAAALIAEAGISVSSYLRDFKKNQVSYLQQEGTPRHQVSLITSWSLTLKHLKERAPLSFIWLNICAQLGPGNIPQAWVQSWLKESSEKSSSRLTSWQLLRALQNYSLIRSDPMMESFSIHSLMKTVISQMQGQKRLEFFQKAFFLLNQEGQKLDTDKVETMKRVEIWVLHAEFIVKTELFAKQKAEDQIKVCSQIYSLTRWLGNYKECLEKAIKILEMRRRIFGIVDHLDIAASLNCKGAVLSDLGRIREALKSFQEALEMQRRIYGPVDHPDIADSLNNLGVVSSELGDNEEALKSYQAALEMRRRIYGPVNHPDIADSLNNLGVVSSELERNEEALKFHQEALEMRRRIYGSVNHPAVADSLVGLGAVLIALRRNKEALKSFQESLEIQRKIYGAIDHPKIATILNNKGAVLSHLGSHEAASKSFQESLEMRRRLYGAVDHPDIADSLNSQGAILRELGRYEKALKSFQDALEMRRRIYGAVDHPKIATTLNNKGIVLQNLGCLEEALEAYQEAIEMRRRIYGAVDHPDTAISLDKQGALLSSLGRHEEALKSYQEALKIRRRIYDTIDHPDIAISLNNLGVVLSELGCHKEALESHQEAMEMQGRFFGVVDHIDIAGSLNNQGLVLSELGCHEEALKSYQEALEMQRRIFGSIDHRNIAGCLQNQCNVLIALGRTQEALKSGQESLEMRRRIYGAVDHPDIAISLNKQGTLLSSLGRHEEALKSYQEALKILRRVYGIIDHPDIAVYLNNQGLVLSALGRKQEALRFIQESLEMQKRIYGDIDHPNIAVCLNNRESVLSDLKLKHKKMLKYSRVIFKMKRKKYRLFTSYLNYRNYLKIFKLNKKYKH